MKSSLYALLTPVLLSVALGGCAGEAARAGDSDGEEAAEATSRATPGGDADALRCDPDNGGLVLPEGFCAVVVADAMGRPRHLDVAPNGDVYVTLRGGRGEPGSAVALRDTTGDGQADVAVTFDDQGGTGVELWNGWVYVGHDDGVVRYRRPEGTLEPSGPAEVIVSGLRAEGGHAAKPVEITPEGVLFVNIGSPSNACQEEDRTAGSPGKDPCEEREDNAGIWRFDADTPGQTFQDGERFAAGLRNTVALRYRAADGELYAAVHGRDQLHQNWESMYSAEEGAELPAEEFVRIREGEDYGWPYCYYDQRLGRKVLAPEYGGDKETVGRCETMADPLVGFPGHWAPNDLLFYDTDASGDAAFPERFRGGAFFAFHGSWNRAPRPQEGAMVVFLPRSGSGFGAEWEVFARGREDWAETREHRPTGLALGPDGSLYIADDAGGRIWRVVHRAGR